MINEKKCPIDLSHPIGKDPEGYLYCEEHRRIDFEMNPHYASRQDSRLVNMHRLHLMNNKIVYREKVQEMASNRTITNEQLKYYFDRLKDQDLRIDVLQKLLGPMGPEKKPLVKLNWPQENDKQTAVIPSSYMRRLSTYTRKRWRQKRLKGEDGTPLIRFWNDGPGSYDPEYERDKKKRAVEEKEEEEMRKRTWDALMKQRKEKKK